jgi:hypothetical protein
MPEMSATGVTDVLCRAIEARSHDFILCNYANADMVGHSGWLAATVRAVGAVDTCLTRALASAERAGATLLVTADHGNCEVMVDPVTGGPHTAHTTNPVPFVIAGDGIRGPLRHGGSLRDVGPTILRMLGVEPPPEMTGRDLRENDDNNAGAEGRAEPLLSFLPVPRLAGPLCGAPPRPGRLRPENPLPRHPRALPSRSAWAGSAGDVCLASGRLTAPRPPAGWRSRRRTHAGHLGATVAQLERTVLDADSTPPLRTGPFGNDILMLDLGLQLRLTGQKSYRRLAPYLGAAIGLAFELSGPTDPGGYTFGTRFTIAPGAGVRIYPGRRLSMAVDFRLLFWTLSYPPSYQSGSPPLVLPGGDTSDWTTHPWTSVGVAWSF